MVFLLQVLKLKLLSCRHSRAYMMQLYIIRIVLTVCTDFLEFSDVSATDGCGIVSSFTLFTQQNYIFILFGNETNRSFFLSVMNLNRDFILGISSWIFASSKLLSIKTLPSTSFSNRNIYWLNESCSYNFQNNDTLKNRRILFETTII
jgi:hypothetical protein